MSFLSRFFAPPMPSLPQDGPILMIDYAMEHRLGVFIHGTLLLEGEKASARWSTTVAGKRNTKPFDITPLLFRTFWRAMDDLPDFKKGWLKDVTAKPDLSKHNLLAMVVDGSRPNEPLFKRRHAIPFEAASNQLRDLLMLVGLGS